MRRSCFWGESLCCSHAAFIELGAAPVDARREIAAMHHQPYRNPDLVALPPALRLELSWSVHRCIHGCILGRMPTAGEITSVAVLLARVCPPGAPANALPPGLGLRLLGAGATLPFVSILCETQEVFARTRTALEGVILRPRVLLARAQGHAFPRTGQMV